MKSRVLPWPMMIASGELASVILGEAEDNTEDRISRNYKYLWLFWLLWLCEPAPSFRAGSFGLLLRRLNLAEP